MDFKKIQRISDKKKWSPRSIHFKCKGCQDLGLLWVVVFLTMTLMRLYEVIRDGPILHFCRYADMPILAFADTADTADTDTTR